MMRCFLLHCVTLVLLSPGNLAANSKSDASQPVQEAGPVAEADLPEASPEEVTKVEEAVSNTKRRTVQFNGEAQGCKDSIRVKQQEVTELNRLIETLQGEKRSCDSDEKAFTGISDDLDFKIAALKAQQSQLEDSLSQLAKQYEEARADSAKARDEVRNVMTELNKTRRMVDEKARLLGSVRGETAHVEASAKDVQSQTNEMDEKIRAYKNAKEAELARAKQQLEMAKVNFTKARADAIKWRNRSNLIYEKIKDAKRASSSWVQIGSA